jgi:hypothetical protein
MNGKQLVQINRGKFVSLDDSIRIEYVIHRGGASEWIISEKNADGIYFSAVDHAPTFEAARIKYLGRMSA